VESLVARRIGEVQIASGACSMLCGCAPIMAGKMPAMRSDGGSTGALAMLCPSCFEAAHLYIIWSKKSLIIISKWRSKPMKLGVADSLHTDVQRESTGGLIFWHLVGMRLRLRWNDLNAC